MTISDNDVLKVVVEFTTAGGEKFQNVLHYIADFATDQADVDVVTDLADALEIAYDELAPDISSSLDDPTIAVDVVEWNVDHWETVQTVGEAILGTTLNNSSDKLPFQCAACVVRRTSKPRSRGRIFLPPFGEDTQAGGTFTAATMSDVADFLLDLLAAIVMSAGNELVPGVPSEVLGVFLPVLAGFANDTVRTQRRRVKGVGF